MALRVYGPEPFNVGADTNLDTFDANWVKISPGSAGWTGVMSVRTATNDVRVNAASATATYRRSTPTVLDERIVAKILAATSNYPGLYTRQDITGPAYLVEWQALENVMTLYRVTFSGGVPTYTSIATGGNVANGATYVGAFVKVTGISPCHIEFGDNTNGVFTFDDSNAARMQSGQPSLSLSTGAAGLAIAIDDVEIYDEALSGLLADYNLCFSMQQRAAS